MNAAMTSRFHSPTSDGLGPEVGEAHVDVQLEELDSGRTLAHGENDRTAIGRRADTLRRMGAIRFGPARVPSRESPEEAVALLVERGFTANEIDFEGGFWMKPEWEWAARFGEAAREAGIALSVHAPIAAFLGHLPGDEGKRKRAFGMLDHTAGVAVAVGAEVVVVHPGFLLGRSREEALEGVVERSRRAARAARGRRSAPSRSGSR